MSWFEYPIWSVGHICFFKHVKATPSGLIQPLRLGLADWLQGDFPQLRKFVGLCSAHQLLQYIHHKSYWWVVSTVYLCAPTWQTVGALPVDCNTTVTSGKKNMGHAFPTIALMAAVSYHPGGKYWKTCPIEEWLAIMKLRQVHGHFKSRHPKWRSCFQIALCSSTP